MRVEKKPIDTYPYAGRVWCCLCFCFFVVTCSWSRAGHPILSPLLSQTSDPHDAFRCSILSRLHRKPELLSLSSSSLSSSLSLWPSPALSLLLTHISLQNCETLDKFWYACRHSFFKKNQTVPLNLLPRIHRQIADYRAGRCNIKQSSRAVWPWILNDSSIAPSAGNNSYLNHPSKSAFYHQSLGEKLIPVRVYRWRLSQRELFSAVVWRECSFQFGGSWKAIASQLHGSNGLALRLLRNNWFALRFHCLAL